MQTAHFTGFLHKLSPSFVRPFLSGTEYLDQQSTCLSSEQMPCRATATTREALPTDVPVYRTRGRVMQLWFLLSLLLGTFYPNRSRLASIRHPRTSSSDQPRGGSLGHMFLSSCPFRPRPHLQTWFILRHCLFQKNVSEPIIISRGGLI